MDGAAFIVVSFAIIAIIAAVRIIALRLIDRHAGKGR